MDDDHAAARAAARNARRMTIVAVRAALAGMFREVPPNTTVRGPAPAPHIMSPLFEYNEPHVVYPRDANYFGHGGSVHILRGVHACNFHSWHLISVPT